MNPSGRRTPHARREEAFRTISDRAAQRDITARDKMFYDWFLKTEGMTVSYKMYIVRARAYNRVGYMKDSYTGSTLYMAFSVSPSGMAKIGQIVYPEVALYSGYGGRAIMYGVFLIVTLLYVIWYARRVIKDPSKSVMNTSEWRQDITQTAHHEMATEDRQVNWRDTTTLQLHARFGEV